MILLGIDTGGTFTDFVLVKDQSLTIHKVLSTPQAPEQAILRGLDELGFNNPLDQDLFIVHGSTVATNAVLEGKVARTVYITNRGMGDILTIGRQARRELYNLQPRPYPSPVPRELCLETGGRVAADGSLLEPLSARDLEIIKQFITEKSPDSVAINLLFSFLDDRYEKQIEQIIPDGVFVSRSSDVLPEIKEYERGVATWLNASVGPVVQAYLQRLDQGVEKMNSAGNPHRISISVMQSSGGTIEARQAAAKSVQLLLSGPAGGLAGAKFIAACSGKQKLLTFDMGGTSTDVAMIDGELQLTNEGSISGYPVAVPMVDLHTIGAGGGSIAFMDEGGLLQVGPQSAGADPGPACYGNGGTQPTVTDANLVLGRLRPDRFLGGKMQLNEAAARQVMAPLAAELGFEIDALAEGIIQVANEHMARALRVMSVQRGLDPRVLTLVSFGGAGGLHVCALAEALSMQSALVPVHSGVLSALGMLVAPRARHVSSAFNKLIDDTDVKILARVFNRLQESAVDDLVKEGLRVDEISIERCVDVRYKGQSYTLTIPWQDQKLTQQKFHVDHQHRYGHRLNLPVEIVTARLIAKGRSAVAQDFQKLLTSNTLDESQNQETISLYNVAQPARLLAREQLAVDDVIFGPALITETVATTFVQSNWQCCRDSTGNLLLTRVST